MEKSILPDPLGKIGKIRKIQPHSMVSTTYRVVFRPKIFQFFQRPGKIDFSGIKRREAEASTVYNIDLASLTERLR